LYRIFQSKHILICSIKKALIGSLIGAFLFNDVSAYALAPEIRLSKPQFREEFKAGYASLANWAANRFIERYLVTRHDGKQRNSVVITNALGAHVKQEFMVVSIPGLQKNTGQAGLVGTGRLRGLPVLYMDDAYYYDQAAIEKTARDYMPGGTGRP